MAYTEAQWNDFQLTLPAEERTSYLDYLKEADPASYNRLVNGLANLKADAQEPAKTTVVDEQKKLAGAKADKAAQEAAARKSALAGLKADAQEPTTKESVSALEGAAQARADKAAEAATLTPDGVPISAVESAAAATAAANAGKTPEQLAADLMNEKNEKTQAAYDRFLKKQPLSAEDKALLGLGADFEYPNVVITTAGPVITTAGPVITTAGPVLTTAGPILTTAGPSLTTISPILTTAAPTLTTAVPTLTTANPTLTTKAPSGFTYTATDGTPFTDQAAFVAYQKMLTEGDLSNKAKIAEDLAGRQSAYDLLYTQFASYGLGTLVEPLKGLIQSGASPAEFALKLRNDPLYNTAYKKRFSANDTRISKGLKAISEAEYLGLEDQYQNILRNAGLPESYWKRGDLGIQEGFTNFIANDVSAVELEDRVSTAQNRLLYANPEVSIALKTFYPDISNGDLLAYALDPTKGLEQIKRRITAAEVGSSAVQLGLTTNVTDAEYLARYGVTKASAQQGYSTIAGGLQRGSQLASIYGEDPYTQTTAEREVFNVPGAQEAKKQRQKITGLEKATFGGQTGLSQGALARDRAGAY